MTQYSRRIVKTTDNSEMFEFIPKVSRIGLNASAIKSVNQLFRFPSGNVAKGLGDNLPDFFLPSPWRLLRALEANEEEFYPRMTASATYVSIPREHNLQAYDTWKAALNAGYRFRGKSSVTGKGMPLCAG